MKALSLIAVAGWLVLGVADPCHAQKGQTSETNPQLKKWLQQFPKADADKDGVLTEAEARAYRDKVAPGGKGQTPNQSRPKPSFANVQYGSHERNVLDVYLAKSDKPTPLVIFIHGGGFVARSKDGVSPRAIEQCHAAGVSIASISYRYVSTDPFPAPQLDAARAVQFLRSKAAEWNLDPQRFAAFGGSAGAGLSMWLGFHDDMAKPESADPVERQSTRLQAIGSTAGQTTYDPNAIKVWVGGRAYEHPSVFLAYGIKTIDQIGDPKLKPVMDEVSAITHATADDPPIYLVYNEADAPLPADARPGQGIHHPVFGRKLKEKLDELGVECVLTHSSSGGGEADLLEHLLKWLSAEPAKSS